MIFWALLTTISVVWFIMYGFTKDTDFRLTSHIYMAASILALTMTN